MELWVLFPPFLEKGGAKIAEPRTSPLAAPFPDGLCRASAPNDRCLSVRVLAVYLLKSTSTPKP